MKKNKYVNKAGVLLVAIILCSVSGVVGKQELSDTDTEFSDGDFTFLIDTILYFNDDTHTLLAVNATTDTVYIFEDVYMNDNHLYYANLSTYCGDNLVWDWENWEIDSTASGGGDSGISWWNRSGTTLYTNYSGDDVQINGTLTMGDIIDMGSNNINNANDIEVEGQLTVRDDIIIQDRIEHLGDLDTYINFNTNHIDIFAGGVNVLDLKPTLADFDVAITTSENITAYAFYGNGNPLTFTWLNLTFLQQYGDPWFNASDAYGFTWAMADGWNASGGGGVTNWTRSGTTIFTKTDNDDLDVNGTIFADLFSGNGNALTFSWLNNTYSKLGHGHDYVPSDYANATFAKMSWVNSTFAPIGSGGYITNWSRSGTTIYTKTNNDDLQVNGTITGGVFSDTSMTNGSVLFSDGTNFTEDNSNLFWNNSINRLGIGINIGFAPRSGLSIVGDLDVIHTASEMDDHALELDVDASGFGDVKGLDIDYITGAIATGQDEGIILINIDETLATGGDVFGLEVLTTDGDAGIYGLKAGALVAPIHQDSGVFVNPTTGTDNTPAVDVPAMIDGSVLTTTAIFENDNEYIIIGAADAFEEMEFILTTESSNPGIKPTFWYSTIGAGQFTQFTPVDGTNGFRNTGVVAWDASDLVGHTTNDDTGTYDIKVIRTQNNLQTEPVLGYAKVASTTEYIWDKNGNLSVNKVTATNNITALSYYGDGSPLTFSWFNNTFGKMLWINNTFSNITHGHVDQGTNTTDDVTFNSISGNGNPLSFTWLNDTFGKMLWSNNTYANISVVNQNIDWINGSFVNITENANQGLNTTDSVTFANITCPEYFAGDGNDIFINATGSNDINLDVGDDFHVDAKDDIHLQSADHIILTASGGLSELIELNFKGLDLYQQNMISYLEITGDGTNYIIRSDNSGEGIEIRSNEDLILDSIDSDIKTDDTIVSTANPILEIALNNFVFEFPGGFGENFNVGNTTYDAGIGYYGNNVKLAQLSLIDGRLQGRGISCTTNKGSSPSVELKTTINDFYNHMVFAPDLAPNLGASFNYTTGGNYHIALMCFDGARKYFEGLRIELIHATDAGLVTIADDLVVEGSISAGDGWTGSWVNNEGDTVTVVNGIITDVS